VEPESLLHLVDAGQQRENLAVDQLIRLWWGGTYPTWVESFGIHPTQHWALLRPVLRNVHPQLQLIEVDVVFGNIGSARWPPSTDHLVAVEAKCWKAMWEDLQPWTQGQDPTTNLWDQVKRNQEAAFDRVAGIDIVATEPGNDYWEALGATDAHGKAKGLWLRTQAQRSQLTCSAGYALFLFGAVGWKDESRSGTLTMRDCWGAPPLGKHKTAIEESVRSILATCSPPQFAPYHFVQHGALRKTPPT
jgi:hypothetical protein